MFWFNIKEENWKEADVPGSSARWGHNVVPIATKFNMKILVLNGSTNGSSKESAMRGVFTNDVMLLDVGERGLWSAPPTTGTPPLPRSNAACAYDEKKGRVIVFGGWADDWLGDINILSVGISDKNGGPTEADCKLTNDELSLLRKHTERVSDGGDVMTFEQTQDFFFTGKVPPPRYSFDLSEQDLGLHVGEGRMIITRPHPKK
mgnify:CR=1 FL=1